MENIKKCFLDKLIWNKNTIRNVSTQIVNIFNIKLKIYNIPLIEGLGGTLRKLSENDMVISYFADMRLSFSSRTEARKSARFWILKSRAIAHLQKILNIFYYINIDNSCHETGYLSAIIPKSNIQNFFSYLNWVNGFASCRYI